MLSNSDAAQNGAGDGGEEETVKEPVETSKIVIKT